MGVPADLAPESCTWLPLIRSLESYRAVVEHSAQLVSHTMRSNIAGIMLYDETSGELALQTPAFGIPDDLAALYRVRLSDGGNAVRVFTTGESYISSDCPSDPSIIQRFIRMYNVKNLVTVPISVDGRIIGVLHAANRARGEFTPRDAETLRVLGSGVGILVRHGREMDTLRRTAEELRQQLQARTGLLQAAFDAAHALVANRPLPLQDLADALGTHLAIYDSSGLPMVSVGPFNHSVAAKVLQEVAHRSDPTAAGAHAVRVSGDSCLVYAPIWDRNRRIGYVVAQCDGHDTGELSLKFVSYVSALLSLFLRERDGHDAVRDLSIRLYSSLVRSVLDTEDPAPAMHLARSLQSRLGRHCLAVLLVPSDPSTSSDEMLALAGHVYDKVKALTDQPVVAVLELALIALVPSGTASPTKIVESLTDAAPVSLKAAHLRVDIAPHPLRTALKSLRAFAVLCQHVRQPDPVIDVGQVWALRELFSIHPDTLRSFVAEVLGPVLALRKSEREGLLNTAEVYVGCGFSVKKASMAQNIHPSTVKYRLSRIQQLMGISLNDPDARFRLAMATRAYRLLRQVGILS